MDRRKFLNYGLVGLPILGLSSYGFYRFSKANNIGTFVAGEELKINNNEEHNYYLSIYDIDNHEKKVISVEYKLHDILISPLNPYYAICPSKWNNKCAIIDLKQLKVIKQIELKNGVQFSGHGSFTPDGKFIYLPMIEYYNDPGLGTIGVYNSSTLEMVTNFPSYGYEPHDFCLLEQGSKLCILNSGLDREDWNLKRKLPEKSNITIVSAKNGELLNSYFYDVPFRRIAHLNKQKMKFGNQLEGLVVCGVEKGDRKNITLHTYQFSKGQLRHMSSPNNIFGHFISIDIDQQNNIAAATAPNNNLVLIWNTLSGELIAKINIKSPRGISISKDKKYFVVGARRNFKLIRIKDLKLIDIFEFDKQEIKLTDHITLVS